MALTRRNALILMVVLVVGAGLIGGTGAFSSVEAERTIDLNTKGDSSALLGLVANDNTIAQSTTGGTGATGDVETLQISNDDLNENAKTVFEDAFTIVNNGDDDIDNLYIEENGTTITAGGPVDFLDADTGDSIVSDGNSVDLGAVGGSVNVSVVIDTRGDVTVDDLPSGGSVTIVAEENDN